jgi:type VI secretion system protein ImpG
VEFFSFPDKFLFFELHGLGSVLPDFPATEVEIDVYLRSAKEFMPRRLAPGAMRLHCTPVVNLFDRPTSPIEIKGRTDRLALVVDPENPQEYEVHAVNQVRLRDSRDVESDLPRYHALRRFTSAAESGPRWEYDTLEHSATAERGTVIGLRFVDDQFAPCKLGDCTVSATVTCSNGDHVRNLPFGDEGCLLQAEALPFVSECRCLVAPTRPRRLRLAQTMWERVEQRLPDPLTLASAQGVAALRSEIQRLSCDDDVVLQSLVSSLSDVRLVRSTGISGGRMLCHGVDAVLVFRRMARFARGQLLLVRVLQELLAHYATDGVIFRLHSQYEDGEEILRCPARSGARPVI